MNPRSRKIAIRACVVCGYKYSDRHHVFPKSLGGEQFRDEINVMVLCPNHHRYANIVQAIIMNSSDGAGFTEAREYAIKNFDNDFNEKVLDVLIDMYFCHLMNPFTLFYLGSHRP